MDVGLANILGVSAPFVLAALLLGVAVGGSRLPLARRRWIERRIFLPLGIVLTVAGLWFTFQAGGWLWTALFLLFGGGTIVRLIRQAFTPDSSTPPCTGPAA